MYIYMCMVVIQNFWRRPFKNSTSIKLSASSCQILELLMSKLNVSVRVTLNPVRNLSELPLKAFYRFVLPDTGAMGPSALVGCVFSVEIAHVEFLQASRHPCHQDLCT